MSEQFRTVSGHPIRAVVFDVFGTVVDWRSGIAAALDRFTHAGDRQADAETLADAWRARYQPSMEPVRAGLREYVDLDVLHRENLLDVLTQYGFDVASIPPEQIDDLVMAWHRLPPWPDVAPGLAQLQRTHRIAPLSNAHTGLLIDVSRNAGLTWDAVVGSNTARAYKPDVRAYHAAAEVFDVEPAEVMLVAAHNADLAGARAAGLATAFLPRPNEFGPHAQPDLAPAADWDIVAATIGEIATRLTGN